VTTILPNWPSVSFRRVASDYHHFFFEDTGRPLDIPGEYVAVSGLPKPPAGAAIRRIDVIIRVGRDPAPAAD
jgi:Fur family iron response transcriptional regulator